MMYRAAIAVCLPLVAAASVLIGGQARDGQTSAGGMQALAVVQHRTWCADLAKVDVAAIGGAGNRITSATEGTGVQAQPMCVVEGALAPSIGIRVEVPLRTWT